MRIDSFIKGLNFKLCVLSIHMNSAQRSFNNVTIYVKEVVEEKLDEKEKAMEKRAKTRVTFKDLTPRDQGVERLKLGQFSPLCSSLKIISRN